MSFRDELTVRLGIVLPIVQAPMAGASGVALAVAVAQAGGLGSLPAAMLTSEQLSGQIDEFRHATQAPVNVNFFCHAAPEVSGAQLDAWSESLSRFDAEFGVDPSTGVIGVTEALVRRRRLPTRRTLSSRSGQLPLRAARA